MYTCPRNHPSDSPDFCSVCGMEIPSQPAQVAALPAPARRPGLAAPKGEVCPECGAPKESPDQVFCEICGFNHRTKAAGVPPAPSPVLPPAGPDPAAKKQPALPAVPATARWDVIITVDANLYGKPHQEAPTGHPPQTFTLFESENIIGRGGSSVRVHVPIRHDDGVSRRQALLAVRPDGGLMVRDLGSANGTQLNGKELVPGVDTAAKDGDAIFVGAWTRITLRAVGS